MKCLFRDFKLPGEFELIPSKYGRKGVMAGCF
jgi:hypothetical protein